MAILLSDSEIDALHGNSEFLYKLYLHALRRYMDYNTGIVGIKRRISYQSIREEMYVEPQSGVKRQETGSPSKSKIRRGLEQLEKIGLVEKIKNKDHIIFHCVLAKRDKSVQNQADTRSAQQGDTQADTVQSQQNLDMTDITTTQYPQADTQAGIPKKPQADTPPVSGKAKEKELLRSSKKKCQLPDNFEVIDHHFSMATKNQWPNPLNEIEAFKDYHMARGTTMLDWDRAFYTWLRNAKKFQGGKLSGNNQQGKPNSFNRAIENIINSSTRSK